MQSAPGSEMLRGVDRCLALQDKPLHRLVQAHSAWPHTSAGADKNIMVVAGEGDDLYLEMSSRGAMNLEESFRDDSESDCGLYESMKSHAAVACPVASPSPSPSPLPSPSHEFDINCALACLDGEIAKLKKAMEALNFGGVDSESKALTMHV